jgi:tetratricopeptide (TPR) repeat protein
MARENRNIPPAVRNRIKGNPKTAEEWNQAGLEVLKSPRRDHDAAILCFQQALQMEPGDARFLANLGLALRGAGRFQKAEAAFKKAVENDPENADAQNGLGGIAFERRNLDRAAKCFEKAIELRPHFPRALNSLGMVMARQGRPDRAFELFKKAIEIKRDFAPAHKSMGDLLLSREQPDEALKAYGAALKLEPKNGDIYRARARVFLMKNDLPKAEQACQRSIKLLPGVQEAHLMLGGVKERMRKFGEAEKAFRTALALDTNSAEAQFRLGRLLSLHKDMFEESEKHLRRAMELRPDFMDARMALGNAYVIKGRMDDAEVLLKEVIEKQPDNVEAYRQLAHIKKAGGREYDHLEKMKALLSDPKVNAVKRAELNYGLAEAYDHMGQYDKAFEHLFTANESDGSRNIYDMEKPRAQCEAIKEVFTPEFFQERKGFGLATEVPVFIVGMPRSGTTLTEQILASHPQAFGAGELNEVGMMRHAVRRIVGSSKPFPRSVPELNQRAVTGMAQKHLDFLQRFDPKAKRVTDKMPFNLFSLGLLALLYPNCKIFWSRRNPLDNCVSCYFLRFVDHMAYATDLKKLGQFYRIHEEIMEYWHQVLPIKILDVKYDETVADQEGATRRMIEHCGLPWDDACLEFHKSKRLVKTPSNWQVRQPIYSSSSGRWRNYEKHLGPLIEGLGLTEEDLKKL